MRLRQVLAFTAVLLALSCREPIKTTHDPKDVKTCGPSAVDCTASAPAHASATCDGTSCGFACESGYHPSGGACTANTELTSCGPSGADCVAARPANSSALCNGASCDFACDVGFHRSGTTCAGNGTLTSCGPSGVNCVGGQPANSSATCDGASCDFACDQGFHRTGAFCTDNNALSNCGPSGVNCVAIEPANSSATCDGASCDFTCDQGFHRTGGTCTPNGTPTNCGPSGTNCNDGLTANATATCDGGTACGFDCNSDYHRSMAGTACDADTSVSSCGAAASDCNTEKPANSTATCGGQPPVCGFSCSPGYCVSGQSCVGCVATSCGASSADAAFSCASIKTDCGSTTNGKYWVTEGQAAAFQVYCDMSFRGGGWALCADAAAGDAAAAYGRDSINPSNPSPDSVYSRNCVPALHSLNTEVLVTTTFNSEWQQWRFIYNVIEGIDDRSGYGGISSVADSRTELAVVAKYHGFCDVPSCPGPNGYSSGVYTWSIPNEFSIKGWTSGTGKNSWYGDFIDNRVAFYVRHQAARLMPDSPTTYCEPTPCPVSGPGYGQDGNYTINTTSPLYIGSHLFDGRLDHVTGLIWQSGAPDAYSWTAASSYCSGLSPAGWRLPTRLELASLIDAGNAAWIDFPNTTVGHYWTSTTLASDTSRAWAFHFGSGEGDSLRAKTESNFTRCVRGDPEPRPKFSLKAETAYDHRTGLMWQRSATATTYSWLDALSNCESSTVDGQTDWRLPSVKELLTIVDETATSGPMIDGTIFSGPGDGYYWSSSPWKNQSGFAWIGSFVTGTVTKTNSTGAQYIRCVR